MICANEYMNIIANEMYYIRNQNAYHVKVGGLLNARFMAQWAENWLFILLFWFLYFFFKMINTTLLATLVEHIKDSKSNPAKRNWVWWRKSLEMNEWTWYEWKNSLDSFKNRLFIHNTLWELTEILLVIPSRARDSRL